MKKKLFFLVTVMTVLLASCEPAETGKGGNNTNPMVNTVWASDYGQGDYLWIEFTSSTEFLEYMGDIDGNTNTTGVSYGTYKYSNGRVDFITHDDTSPFDYATIKGSIMTLVYKSGWDRTYKKK